MYEFLAPWGALAPALSAAVTYLYVAEKRRLAMLRMIQAPDPAEESLSTSASSYLRTFSRLSEVHG